MPGSPKTTNDASACRNIGFVATRRVLTEPELQKRMVTHNYRTALRFYPYSALEQKLYAVMSEVTPNKLQPNRNPE